MRHISAVTQFLQLEIGFAGDLGAAGLCEAIIEALEEKVIDAGGVVYIKASTPGNVLMAIDLWAPDPVVAEEPPEMPEEEEGPKAN